jgi:hypothetical protein
MIATSTQLFIDNYGLQVNEMRLPTEEIPGSDVYSDRMNKNTGL